MLGVTQHIRNAVSLRNSGFRNQNLMSTNKTIIIGATLLIFIVLVVFVYNNLTSKKIEAPSTPEAPFGKFNIVVPERKEAIMVNDVFNPPGGQQKPIQVINDPATQTTSALLSETENYQLVAFSGSGRQSFIIYITTSGIRETRMVAEADLISRLGVEKGNMCELPIRVVVANTFADKISEDEIGLSFCPGSTSF